MVTAVRVTAVRVTAVRITAVRVTAVRVRLGGVRLSRLASPNTSLTLNLTPAYPYYSAYYSA